MWLGGELELTEIHAFHIGTADTPKSLDITMVVNQCFQHCNVIPGLPLSGGSNNEKCWQPWKVDNGIGQFIVCFQISMFCWVNLRFYWEGIWGCLLNCKLSQAGLESINSISQSVFAFITMKRRFCVILTSYKCYYADLPIFTCRVVNYGNGGGAVFSNISKKNSVSVCGKLLLQQHLQYYWPV